MKRAILAAVVSIALVLAGAVALPTTDHAQAGLGGAAGNAGDANCDLEVDATDAALVLQYDAGLIAGFQECADPDADADQMINSIDAQLILQYSAGFIDGLPPL
jgi:hypothetical protein